MHSHLLVIGHVISYPNSHKVQYSFADNMKWGKLHVILVVNVQKWALFLQGDNMVEITLEVVTKLLWSGHDFPQTKEYYSCRKSSSW